MNRVQDAGSVAAVGDKCECARVLVGHRRMAFASLDIVLFARR